MIINNNNNIGTVFCARKTVVPCCVEFHVVLNEPAVPFADKVKTPVPVFQK